jgi:2-polyprenyl-6-methoxyphenol hydroxylase-like FAD-dependent oxidoreductase
VQGDLVVGADGIHSPVRHQYLPQHHLLDVEVSAIYGKTPLTAELTDQFPEEALRYMTFISDSTPLTMLAEADRFHKDPAAVSSGKPTSVTDYVYWVLISRRTTFGMTDAEMLSLPKEKVAELSLKVTESWHPSIRSTLRLQSVDRASALRISSFHPTLEPWKPSASVTLLGDAIHTMSPTGGAGANTALKDTAELCEAIVRAGGSITEEAIGQYEEAMREYAGNAIQWSYMGGKKFFNMPPFDECSPLGK